MTSVLALALCVLATAAAASFGAKFMPDAWYVALKKPSWNPPNWVFAPAWTILYIMIATAGWLAWKSEGAGRLLAVWAIGLVFNGAWSYLFFGQRQIGLALADSLAMLVMIVVFVAMAWGPVRPAALLFMPYLAWVTFATILNATIWRLNS
jgi:translocator protein